VHGQLPKLPLLVVGVLAGDAKGRHFPAVVHYVFAPSDFDEPKRCALRPEAEQRSSSRSGGGCCCCGCRTGGRCGRGRCTGSAGSSTSLSCVGLRPEYV
jgi:hypothetical protein